MLPVFDVAFLFVRVLSIGMRPFFFLSIHLNLVSRVRSENAPALNFVGDGIIATKGDCG
jgi:hypothetical protein